MGGLDNPLCIVSGQGLEIALNGLPFPKDWFIKEILDGLDWTSLAEYSYDDLTSILSDSIGTACDQIPLEIHKTRWSRRTFVVGVFCDSHFPFWDKAKKRFVDLPRGPKISTRLVNVWCLTYGDGPGSRRMFPSHILPDGSLVQEETWCYGADHYGERVHPNILVREGPYHYLQAWIDWNSLPPPKPGSSPLQFAQELYEIVQSRLRPLSIVDRTVGLLPAIDYGGVEIESDYRIDDPRLRGVAQIQRALRDGLRGKELFQAIRDDCLAWQAEDPDCWPRPSPNWFIPAIKPAGRTPFDLFPTETLLEILSWSNIASQLSLSSASRAMQTRFRPVINDSLRHRVYHGDLRWIIPVSSLPQEKIVGFDAILAWKGDMLSMYKACHLSDSMRSRERLWKIAKQYEILWRHYRLYGWEVDVFSDT